MKQIILFIAVIITCSCSLFNGLKKQEFSAANSFQILVPKGWAKVISTPDSTGRKELVYTYSNGASFYISNTGKPINSNEIIDTVQHIALSHVSGAVMYKGVMPGLLYWRELQKDQYRFGYRNVPTDLENRFDSALNYSVLMKEIR